jgi:hypothetical protein
MLPYHTIYGPVFVAVAGMQDPDRSFGTLIQYVVGWIGSVTA